MNPGLVLLEANLGATLENVILLAFMLGCMIFYAKDFKVGVVLQFIISGCLFLAFYALNEEFGGWNYIPSLVVFLITVVIMSITMYTTFKVARQGAII